MRRLVNPARAIAELSDDAELHRLVVFFVAFAGAIKDAGRQFHFFDAIDPEQLPMLVLVGVARAFDLIGPEEELPGRAVAKGVRLNEAPTRIVKNPEQKPVDNGFPQ